MTTPLNASLRSRPLTVTSWLYDVPGDTLNASHLESSMVQLSHLEFLSPCVDSKNHMAPPILVAVRSYLPGLASHYNQEVHTTIDRWEFRERNQQPVHPAFEHSSSRKGTDGSQPVKPMVGCLLCLNGIKLAHICRLLLSSRSLKVLPSIRSLLLCKRCILGKSSALCIVMVRSITGIDSL